MSANNCPSFSENEGGCGVRGGGEVGGGADRKTDRQTDVGHSENRSGGGQRERDGGHCIITGERQKDNMNE